MGRIEGIIPDDLEQRLRIEIIKRYGGKKGDLVKGMIEAIQLWVDRPTVEKLKEQATSPDLLPSDRVESTRALGQMGDSALDALIEVHGSKDVLPSERGVATEEINKILKDRHRTRGTLSVVKTES